MTGYEYASFIQNTCRELRKEIQVIPVMGHVYRPNSIPSPKWATVLCHPEDKDKTDEKEFKHPYRDI